MSISVYFIWLPLGMNFCYHKVIWNIRKVHIWHRISNFLRQLRCYNRFSWSAFFYVIREVISGLLLALLSSFFRINLIESNSGPVHYFQSLSRPRINKNSSLSFSLFSFFAIFLYKISWMIPVGWSLISFKLACFYSHKRW